MLAVIFGILKILGLLILGILGLILLVLCLILFVPICYRADLSLYEKFCAEATVSWLFRAISLTVRRKEKTEISLRIFGIPLGKKKRAEAVAVEKEQSKASEESTPGRVTVQPKEESKEEPKEKESGNPMKPERSEITETSGTPRKSETVIKKSKQPEQTEQPEKLSEKKREENKEDPKNPKRTTEEIQETQETSKKTKQKNPIERIKQKAKTILGKIKMFLSGLRGRLGGLKKRLMRIGSNLQELNEKRKRLMEFLRKEENKRVFRLLKRQFVRFLRHVLPQKLSGKLVFGLGDPYLTGQVLTVVSPFYGFYGRNFALTPVFDAEELVLEGEAKFRGRIRIGTLIWIGLRILIDKDARRLWKTWRNSRR